MDITYILLSANKKKVILAFEISKVKCTFVNIHKTSFSKSGDIIKVNTLKVVFASLDLIK